MRVLHQCFVVYVAACLTLSSGGPLSPKPKVTDLSNTAAPPGSPCEPRTPCAWGVYVPYTRRVDYYMKNTCVCSQGLDCLKMDDDIAVSAYLYRCGKYDPNATVDDPYSDFPVKLPDWVTKGSTS